MANVNITGNRLTVGPTVLVRHERIDVGLTDDHDDIVGWISLNHKEATALLNDLVVAVQRLEAHQREKGGATS